LVAPPAVVEQSVVSSISTVKSVHIILILMIVSHKHRYIFIKTRKTAGTSVEIALSVNCGPNDIITLKVDEKIKSKLRYKAAQNYKINRKGIIDHLMGLLGFDKFYYPHIPAYKIRKIIGEEIFSNYHKFCVVRNPWDRVVSTYFWRLKNSDYFNLDVETTFTDFIDQSSSEILSDKHLFTVDGKSMVDTVIRYENLDSELNNALSKLGLPKAELPNAKSGTRASKAHYSTYYDDKSLEKINQICAWEIDKFGYTFEDLRNQ